MKLILMRAFVCCYVAASSALAAGVLWMFVLGPDPAVPVRVHRTHVGGTEWIFVRGRGVDFSVHRGADGIDGLVVDEIWLTRRPDGTWTETGGGR